MNAYKPSTGGTHQTTNRPVPLTVVVHDGNGTWFSLSGLVLSALTDEEFELLEQGNESLLNAVPKVGLLDALSDAWLQDPAFRWE